MGVIVTLHVDTKGENENQSVCCLEGNCAHYDMEVLVQFQLRLGSLGEK